MIQLNTLNAIMLIYKYYPHGYSTMGAIKLMYKYYPQNNMFYYIKVQMYLTIINTINKFNTFLLY